MLKESYLYQKLDKKQIKCRTCAHQCLIAPGRRGICGVRYNEAGKLYLLTYGQAVAENFDPIEKKPFFHFLPGSFSLSIGALGCNFRCANCQNWDISQSSKGEVTIEQIKKVGFKLLPEKIVEDALKYKTPSVSYTYTEPTIFLEYALDTMKLAKKRGLKNTWVSNGYMSPGTLKEIAPYLDAINVDLKGFSNEFYQKNCGARLQPVLDNLKQIKKLGIWLEVTTLIIPTLSDSEKMLKNLARFIKKELGAETPWHVSAFSGAISWQLQHLPDTPREKIKTAYEIGKKAGLKYVYAGNVWQEDLESTYCPKCGRKAIERLGYQIKRLDKEGKCLKCGEKIDLIIQ